MDCIMIQYDEHTGTIEIPGAAETEDWMDVRIHAGVDPVRVGYLVGWGRWTAHYTLDVDERTLHYAVEE